MLNWPEFLNNTNSELEPFFYGGSAIPFNSPNRSYIVDIYYSDRKIFTQMPDYEGLVDCILDLHTKQIYPFRERERSAERMRRNLSHPKTIAMLARYEDTAIGYGIFPRFHIPISPDYYSPKRDVLYSSRGFIPKHTRRGLGTFMLGRAIDLHQQELSRGHRVLEWVALMTQNAASIASLEILKELGIIDEIYPSGKRYEKGSEQEKLLIGLYGGIKMGATSLENATGVAREELREVGMNENIPPKGSERIINIYRFMINPTYEGGLGMNINGGDVALVLSKLKKNYEIKLFDKAA